MKTEAVGPLLPASIPLPGDVDVPPPDPASIERFATLMTMPDLPATPSELLQSQTRLAHMSMGSDLTAKVAGLLTQAVNKLVNMQ